MLGFKRSLNWNRSDLARQRSKTLRKGGNTLINMAEGGRHPTSKEDNNTVDSDFVTTVDSVNVDFKPDNKDLQSLKSELEETATKKGVGAINDFLHNKLDSWKKTPVNVAVIGNSKVGKSSFINSIRDLKNDDEGAAKVGHTETTCDIKPYRYPKHANIIFWDLPGIGTPTFTRDTYEDKINQLLTEYSDDSNGIENVSSFDFFLILSKDTFTENDAWIANKVGNEYKKKYFFVRTNIDVNIQNEKRSNRRPRDESTIKHEIRKNCKDALQKAKLTCDTIYLVDNNAPETFDFESLKTDLIIRAPQAKADALAFSISVLSKEVIQQKKMQLSKRVRYTALKYIIGGRADSEVDFYREQFGLTDDALCQTARLLGTSKDVLCLELALQSPFVEDNSTERMINTASSICVSLGLLSLSSSVAGLFGLFLQSGNCVRNYKSVNQFLNQCLELCAADALKIQEFVLTKRDV